MRIAHISDVHFGFELIRDKVEKAIKQINELEPDLVILTGDIGQWGIHHEFKDAYETLSDLKPDLFAIPGNHDARNDGLKYFQLYFGRRKKSVKLDDVVVVGVDSTLPDSDDGYVGPEQREWIAGKVRKNCINVIAMHHHVVPIPHTGRNRNVLIDAAETVEALTLHCHGGIVLAGHRHVPYSTKLLRTHIIHAGSLSSYKVLMPDHSYNVIDISGDKITLKLRFVDFGEIEIGTFTLKPEPAESLLKYHRLTSTKKVLFVSEKDSCRTKIAEAVFNRLAPHNMYALSAGLQPGREVDGTAKAVAEKYGLKLTEPRKLSSEMVDDADYVISFEEGIEGIRVDEVWKIRHPETAEECHKILKELESAVRSLIKNLLVR
ncbi:metallophosphoesterase [Geoglobus sp.]